MLRRGPNLISGAFYFAVGGDVCLMFGLGVGEVGYVVVAAEEIEVIGRGWVGDGLQRAEARDRDGTWG